MAIAEQDVSIPKPLSNGTTDQPDAAQAGAVAPPPLPEGYSRVTEGNGTQPTPPPLPQGYVRATAPKPVVEKTTAPVTTKPSTSASAVQSATQTAAPATHVPTDLEKHDEGIVNDVTATAHAGYNAAKGLYHGVMGDEESSASKGPTTVASPEAANLGFTPEHMGYKAGEMAHGVGKLVGEAAKDIAGNTPVVVPNEKGVSIADPKAHTLLAKYVTAPSQTERDASQKEMQKYFETKGPEAAGHAITAFLHGTLGEYVPMVGPLAMSLVDQAQKGDLGGALSQIASLYAFEKGTGAVKDGIKERVSAKVADLNKTPEVKQAEANVATLAKEKDAAQAKLDAAAEKHNQYTASHAQGIGSPEKVANEVKKAQDALDEATAHHELAKEDLAKKTAQQPTIPQRVGGAVGNAIGKVLPAKPEVPAEEVEAAPVLKPLGKPEPARAPIPAINVKTPGQVQPETFPQTPTERPRAPYGRIELAGEQGTVGTPRLLTEGTPEGPQLPKGGLPKINLPEVKAETPKPEVGNLKSLKAEGGKVVDKEETPEGRIGKLLQDALKSEPAPVKENSAAKAEEAPTEKRAGERRQGTTPVETEQRTSERRGMAPNLESLWQEGAFGKKAEGDVGTKVREANPEPAGRGAEQERRAVPREKLEVRDQADRLFAQARKELGENATSEDIDKRMEELKKPSLPKEENTGYTPKAEEIVPAGAEGRTPAKSAEEYHPAVEQKVSELSDENLKKLAKAHGLNPDEYNFNARDERRHRTERDQLAKDITAQMGEDEKINLGRASENAEREPGFANVDKSAKGRADRAAKLFPRLRGPVDEFGNPKISGGAPHGNVDVSKDKDFSYNGVWHVKGEGFQAQMYRDPESTNWYETGGEKDKDFRNNLLSTGTKEEAIKTLAEKYGSKYEPPVKKPTGFSQKADQRYPATVGTAEGAKSDTEHFANAKKELGESASISDVAKRAQEMKDASKGTSFKQQRAMDEVAYKNADLKRVISDYNKTEGLPEVKDNKIEVDPRSKEIARAYDDMKHDPSNPEVKKSYAALIEDAKKQWDALTKAGIKLEPQDEDPYKSYDEMKKDFNDNKRLKVWRGGNELPEDHPLAKVDPKTGETYNVMFRAVHDAIGHLLHDNDFSEKGEANAFDTHRQTMSKEAIPAMTTDTKGQVSWVMNHGGSFEGLEQKAGILPDRFVEDAPDPKAVLDHLKSGKDYALLTAENPNNERATPEQNAQKNREMKAELEKMGYKPTPVEGHVKDVEGQKENSFFVPDISPKDAAKVSRKFGQASVMTKQGIHDLVKDTVHPSTGVLEGDEAAKQDYHSTVAGKPFSVSVDFSKEEKPTGEEKPQSVGSARAGTSLAKESPLTAKQLQERLPDLAQKHLTPEEKESITTTATGKPRNAGTEKFVKNMAEIPTVREYTDIALQGEGARKWYSRSTAAFDAMHEEAPEYFKEGDKEKFMGVLAGSSPQQSVAMNLRETLGFWKEWNDAGRPKFSLDKWKEFGDEADKAWKEDGSPRSGGTMKGASQHWDYAPTGPKWKAENLLLKNLTLPETKVPNIIKALNGEQMWPDLTKNQAFKAPSFAENLRKWIDGKSTGTKNVTNDSWMGLFGGIDKSALSKPENYHPLSVATRAAAEALGWEPEEAQAAIWSFTQALTEKGVEDPEVIRHYSEDFKDLLANDLDTRDILGKLGVNLEQLDRKLEAIGEKPKVSGRSTPTTAHSVGQLRSRIEEARGKGAIPEPKAIQGSLFRENPAFENRSRLTDEATEFNPEKFRTKTDEPLGKLGEKKKKSPFGNLR